MSEPTLSVLYCPGCGCVLFGKDECEWCGPIYKRSIENGRYCVNCGGLKLVNHNHKMDKKEGKG